MNKIIYLYAVLVLTFLLAVSFVSAADQIRPMSQASNPGILSPYHAPPEGVNHMGISDYTNKWMSMSELCESDYQIRPDRQGGFWIKSFICHLLG